tara:strand:+ start:744 stop:965 length:222 start_codon:yes stop_codon:yes gene_type:complete
MHYEPIFPYLLLSKIPLAVLTIVLSLLASVSLRFWGYMHPQSIIPTMSVIWLMLFGPVVVVGIFSFYITFNEK